MASVPAASIVIAWVTIRNSRRSTMSASAPPGSASRNTGRMVAACTIATTIGFGSSVVISQPAPVFCSQVPSHTTTLAVHNRRNIRLRRGNRADGSLIEADWIGFGAAGWSTGNGFHVPALSANPGEGCHINRITFAHG
jgi:hypothetical protein